MRTEEIKNIVAEYLTDKDIQLVDVIIGAGNIIEVEVDALRGVTIVECCEISRHIEEQFDREKEDFELTVSSYSISEPFKSIMQYRKNEGRDVEVKLNDDTIIIAKLTSVKDENFTLEYDEKVAIEGKKRKELQHFTVEVTYDSVKATKLVF